MADREKVIERLEKAKLIIETWVPMFEQYNAPAGIDEAIELLKEQQEKIEKLESDKGLGRKSGHNGKVVNVMGLTERHWFENEEPELTERQLEDIVYENKRAYDSGYVKGYSDRDKEIVRCKNCKYGDPCKGFTEPYIECTIMSDLKEDRYHEEDWFCAAGKQKET